MSTFLTTFRPTPFGFYDSDPVFQQDADKVVFFVLRKLGEDILSVELTKKMIWSCFEEATLAFNSHIIEYQAKSNLSNLLGQPTGSVDPNNPTENTAQLDVNLTDNYIRPNLEFLVRQAEPYAAEIGHGQSLDTYSGSIDLQLGKQDYDLYTDLRDATGVPLSNYMPTGSRGRMKIVEVYHHDPKNRYSYFYGGSYGGGYGAHGGYGQSAGGGAGGGYDYHVMPLFEDTLRATMFETSNRIRTSHYRYRISGRNIRIFPMPGHGGDPFSGFLGGVVQNETSGSAASGLKLWVRVAFPQSPAPGIVGTSFSGSVGAGLGQDPALPDDTLFGASHPANVPFGLIKYSTLNPWAKHWIFQYTLACCRELLGLIRSKFANFPIPGSDLQLNGDSLVTQGREDKQSLITGDNGLLQKLESLTYDKLAEIEANKAEFEQKKLQMLPFPPKYVLSMG